MRFEQSIARGGKPGTVFRAPLAPQLDELALFPSELEAEHESQKSSAARVEAFSLADFASENVPVAPEPETQVDRPSPVAAESPRHEGAWNTGLVFIAAFIVTLGTLSALTFIDRRSASDGRVSAPHRQAAVPISPGALPVPAAAEPQPEYQSAAAAIDTATTRQVALPVARPPEALTASPRQHTDSTQPPVAAGGPLPSADTVPAVRPSPKLIDVRVPAVDPLRFQGVLAIETPVAGAQVYVDGRPEGFTPVSELRLSAGSHVVRIEFDGYERWSAVIRVVAEQTTHVIAHLRPIQLK